MSDEKKIMSIEVRVNYTDGSSSTKEYDYLQGAGVLKNSSESAIEIGRFNLGKSCMHTEVLVTDALIKGLNPGVILMSQIVGDK